MRKSIKSILGGVFLLSLPLLLTSCDEFWNLLENPVVEETPDPTPPPPSPPVYTNLTSPLTFEASTPNVNVTFKITGAQLNYTSVEYSTDGITWRTLSSNNQAINLANVGDYVMFRGTNASYNGDGQFVVETTAATARNVTRSPISMIRARIYGNIMSLINKSEFSSLTSLSAANEGAFKNLFKDCPIDASSNDGEKALVLPATTLVKDCYNGMFQGCTTLEKAPELPAPTLVENCYSGMFQGCSNLSEVTILATSVADGTTADECLSNWLTDAGTDAEQTSITMADNSQIDVADLTKNAGDTDTNWNVQDEKGEKVQTVDVTSVELNKTELPLLIGETATLTATIAPENATDKTISWKSSNETVATVDSNGNIKALAAGETTITVTTKNSGKTTSCKVSVTKPVTDPTINQPDGYGDGGDPTVAS